MQTIKISTTAKGLHHWETYLMEKQERRLNKLLIQLEIDPWTKRKVITIFKHKCGPENIIPLSIHPIKIFLHALIHNELKELENHSSLIRTK